ncbi:MAG TPA: NUDIX domain-containing protein [Candidatus Limiplasma sp.]|mgnify:CR=1 FL=1|nr:NUDIX domain-containing protein [Candidatus Limiplasma sp.]HRX09226.1 NUDIX domain-containing protein [Candidatus Limiplasma sp.]
MEQWDAYLPDGRQAGRTLLRAEPIPAGLYHIVSDVLVRHADGDYLVMQRDLRKETYPGKFEAGASGSILAGESPVEGALRELREETGIVADALIFLFATSNLRDTQYYCYLCRTDCAKDAVTLQAGETIACQWLSETDFRRFILSPAFASGPRERWLPYLDNIQAFDHHQ